MRWAAGCSVIVSLYSTAREDILCLYSQLMNMQQLQCDILCLYSTSREDCVQLSFGADLQCRLGWLSHPLRANEYATAVYRQSQPDWPSFWCPLYRGNETYCFVIVECLWWISHYVSADHHMGCSGIMFLTCPSICVCVRACSASTEAFSDWLVVDL